jgi:hypothetical protein
MIGAFGSRTQDVPAIKINGDSLGTWTIRADSGHFANITFLLSDNSSSHLSLHVPLTFCFSRFRRGFSVDPRAEPFVPQHLRNIKTRDFELEQSRTRRMFAEYENADEPDKYDANGRALSKSVGTTDTAVISAISEPAAAKRDFTALKLYEKTQRHNPDEDDAVLYAIRRPKVKKPDYGMQRSFVFNMKRYSALKFVTLFIGRDVDARAFVHEARRVLQEDGHVARILNKADPDEAAGRLPVVDEAQIEGDPVNRDVTLRFLTHLFEALSDNLGLEDLPDVSDEKMHIGQWKITGPQYDRADVHVFRDSPLTNRIELRVPRTFSFRHFPTFHADLLEPPRTITPGRASRYWTDVLIQGDAVDPINQHIGDAIGKQSLNCWVMRADSGAIGRGRQLARTPAYYEINDREGAFPSWYYSLHRSKTINKVLLYIGREVPVDQFTRLGKKLRREEEQDHPGVTEAVEDSEPRDLGGYLPANATFGTHGPVFSAGRVRWFLTQLLDGVDQHVDLAQLPKPASGSEKIGTWSLRTSEGPTIDVEIIRVSLFPLDIKLMVPFDFSFRDYINFTVDGPMSPYNQTSVRYWRSQYPGMRGLPWTTDYVDERGLIMGESALHFHPPSKSRSPKPGVTISWVDSEGNVHNDVRRFDQPDPVSPPISEKISDVFAPEKTDLQVRQNALRDEIRERVQEFIGLVRTSPDEPTSDLAAHAPPPSEDSPSEYSTSAHHTAAAPVNLALGDSSMEDGDTLDEDEEDELEDDDFEHIVQEDATSPFQAAPRSIETRPPTPQEAVESRSGSLGPANAPSDEPTPFTLNDGGRMLTDSPRPADPVQRHLSLADALENNGWPTEHSANSWDGAPQCEPTPPPRSASGDDSYVFNLANFGARSVRSRSNSDASMPGLEDVSSPHEPRPTPGWHWGGPYEFGLLVQKIDALKLTIDALSARTDAQTHDLAHAVENSTHETRVEVRDLGRDSSQQLSDVSDHLGDVVRELHAHLGKPVKHIKNVVTSTSTDASAIVHTLDRFEERITPRLENIERFIINAYGASFLFSSLVSKIEIVLTTAYLAQAIPSAHSARAAQSQSPADCTSLVPSTAPTLPSEYQYLVPPGSQTLATGTWYLPAATSPIDLSAGVASTTPSDVAAGTLGALTLSKLPPWRTYAHAPLF